MSDHHESPIKTPKDLITVVVLAFVIPISLIGFLVAYVTGGTHGNAPQGAKPESVAERIAPVAAVTVRDANAPKVLQSGEQVYKAICAACHDSGAANAPKMGDKAAWAPRLKVGGDELIKSAIKGKNAMPPKGGNPDLDDVELGRAVVFLANASGASFKEPAAPAAPAKAEEKKDAAPAAAAVVIPLPVVAAAPAAAKGDTGKALYEATCQVCHAAGVANAPKFGDKAAWAPRIATGIDAMTQSVVKGKGAMPPKGTAMAASDADLKAAVTYMAGAAK
jgi:cytochrome c5